VRTTRPHPKLLLTEEEEAIYDDYVSSYRKDYGPLTPTDLIQLYDAALYHIEQYRLLNSDATSTQKGNIRTHPKQLERSILDDLGMTRRQRLTTRPTASTDEDALREFFMEVGRQPLKVKSNGQTRATTN
jgi:hypothetical protein